MATTYSAPAPSSPAPSRQARLTIKEAFTRLSQSITPDDARRFQSTTLKDVRQAAVEVEDKLATSQSLRNMRRVESLLNGIEHYSKVLEVLCNGTPYLPWIWVPWQRFFDSSWGRFDARFKRILSSLAQHADLIDREANAIDIAAAETMRQKLNDDFSRREKENALIQRSAAISWLNLDNSITSQEDELDRLLAHCHSGSCDWFLKNAKIEQWMSDGQTQRFTWIYGKPGADSTEIGTQNDPTTMRRLMREYESVVQALLSADAIPGLSQDVLEDFKRSNGTGAFFCRFSTCVDASNTFQSESARDAHERLVHMKRLLCQAVSCPYPGVGFKTPKDLKRHMQTYHPGPRPSVVPPSVRRTNLHPQSTLPRMWRGSQPEDNEQISDTHEAIAYGDDQLPLSSQHKQMLQQAILTGIRSSHPPTHGQWQSQLNADQRAGMVWNM
ncbi:hypothetical protein BK809_0000652 [Diplodia seriata]|uniref:C2H2-type domain-containing protein n=1 Tax=Diplodia seriata TaxID=420778 RepID=A0A1S8BBL2_9PEZI|nr:hypothetical protein BK809_0000652 [Diplodia seriata]